MSPPPVRFVLVLHAHLPFVRHPEHEFFLEENWLYEAVAESYLPLLQVFSGLLEEGTPCPATFSLSPTLIEMLEDPLLRQRCARYLATRRALAECLHEREKDGLRRETLRLYSSRFANAVNAFDHYGHDLVNAWGSLKTGGVELFTTAATHGFLPYLMSMPGSVEAQVGIGVAHHRQKFGQAPKGMWLPECGYARGLDEQLLKHGIHHTVLDAHAFLFSENAPAYGPFEPVQTPAGLVVLGRDPFPCGQVWAPHGYPADPDYREFHWDIGFDIPAEDVRRFVHPDGIRAPTGIKCHRVTGGSDRNKETYDRARALSKTSVHAHHFVNLLVSRADMLRQEGVRQPVIVCAFDAELFGHWWFEGPEWLEGVYRKLTRHREIIRPATVQEVVAESAALPVIDPAPSSWGEGGFGDVWLDHETDWIYPRLSEAVRTLTSALRSKPSRFRPPLMELEKAARELLLAQASDWPFLIRQKAAPGYARRRLENHLRRFQNLIEKGAARDRAGPKKRATCEPQLFRRIRCTSFFAPEDHRKDRP